MPGVTYRTVSRAESGQKLLQFLERQLRGQMPRSAIMRWIRTGQVRVDGGRCKPFQRIHQGQKVRLPPYSLQEDQSLSEDSANPFALRRVHEDRDILVLAKPPNLASQPGTGVEDSVSDRLQAEFAGREWIPALVHRLDKATSGLLLVAKSYSALQHVHTLWRSGKVDKIYLAWVWGHPDWPQWTHLQDELSKSSEGRTKQVRAEAWAKSIRLEAQASLVAVRLITGRKHQIRLQLSRRDYPLIGDRKYGSGPGGGQGLLLHAAVLRWADRSYELIPPWQGQFAVHAEDMDML